MRSSPGRCLKNSPRQAWDLLRLAWSLRPHMFLLVVAQDANNATVADTLAVTVLKTRPAASISSVPMSFSPSSEKGDDFRRANVLNPSERNKFFHGCQRLCIH